MKRRLVSSWISTVISISLVLLLVGVASLLLVNARKVSDYVKENMQISVMLVQEASDQDAEKLAASLGEIPGIKGTRVVSREEGIDEMASMLGRDFLDVFQEAPIPVSIDLNLEAAYVGADSIAVVCAAVQKSPLVEEVVYQTSLVEALNANIEKISVVIAVLIALLLFVSVVLIANTVRLNVFAKRFVIHTMQQVGATRSFIRSPFVLQSAFQGTFAALIAIFMLLGGLFVLRSEFSQLFAMFPRNLLLLTMGIMVCAGILICTVSTWIVVTKVLGYDKDRLYSEY